MTDPPPEPRLKFFPVSFFAMIMGLTGLSLAWQKAESVYGIQLRVSEATLVLTGQMPPGVHLRPEGGGESRHVIILWPYHAEPVAETFPDLRTAQMPGGGLSAAPRGKLSGRISSRG